MGKITILWSDFALDELEKAAEHIEKHSSFENAQKFIIETFERVEQLIEFPQSGRIEDNLKKLKLQHRFILLNSQHKIIYRLINESTIYITDVFPCKKTEQPVKNPQINNFPYNQHLHPLFL